MVRPGIPRSEPQTNRCLGLEQLVDGRVVVGEDGGLADPLAQCGSVDQRPAGAARVHRFLDRRQVELSGKAVDLTAREFDLLEFLARHPGQVFSRDELLDKVWDWAYVSDGGTVTVHIRRLRQKIEPDAERPRYLKTVWGAGYKFDPS